MTPQSAPDHLLFFPADCLPAFSDLFMLFFKLAPQTPVLPSAHYPSMEVRGDSFWICQFMRSKPEPLTVVLPVGGTDSDLRRMLLPLDDWRSKHWGVSSKFHSGISGQPVPFDDIFSRATWSAWCISAGILNYQQMVCLKASQLVHIDV